VTVSVDLNIDDDEADCCIRQFFTSTTWAARNITSHAEATLKPMSTVTKTQAAGTLARLVTTPYYMGTTPSPLWPLP